MTRTFLALSLFLSMSASASTDPTYATLRAGRPDGRTIPVKDLSFDRDAYRITLDGTLHLLAPLSGKNIGAVFIGHGAYELTPATEVERKSLAINASDPSLKTLRDEFDSMIVFDTDLLAQAAKAAPLSTGAADSAAMQAWDRFLKFEQTELR